MACNFSITSAACVATAVRWESPRSPPLSAGHIQRPSSLHKRQSGAFDPVRDHRSALGDGWGELANVVGLEPFPSPGRRGIFGPRVSWPSPKTMITDIEDYFIKGCGRCDRFDTPACSTMRWEKGLKTLREICRNAGLEEAVKWAHPCYRHAGRNIVIIGALRNDFRLSFSMPA